MYIYFFGNINILATFVEIRKGCVCINSSTKSLRVLWNGSDSAKPRKDFVQSGFTKAKRLRKYSTLGEIKTTIK